MIVGIGHRQDCTPAERRPLPIDLLARFSNKSRTIARRTRRTTDQAITMPTIKLPDGSERSYENSVTGDEIAAAIGKSLARDAVAIRVHDELWDLTRSIADDSPIEIITRDTSDGLELLRHDAAHVLAEAVKELWPETQVTIGPAIENGFYYDFAREEPFTPEDLLVIEEGMKEIVDRDESIQREVWERDKAIEFFRGIGEDYKAQIIEEIPENETLTLYRQGDFIDLCRGQSSFAATRTA